MNETELREAIRELLLKLQDHIEKDHPDPDMRECLWVGEVTIEIYDLLTPYGDSRERAGRLRELRDVAKVYVDFDDLHTHVQDRILTLKESK